METNCCSRWVNLRGAWVAAMFISTLLVRAAETPPLIEWQASFGGTGGDYLRRVVPTADGGFVSQGRSTSGVSGNKTSTAYGSGDLWLVKMDALGNKVWDKSFGGNDDEGFYYSALAATSDGGFLLGGDSWSGISGNKTSPNYGGGDMWLVKVDSSGTKLWDKSFGGNGVYDVLVTIVATDDEGALLGGFSDSGVSGNKASSNHGTFDFWLVKVDANGNKLWDKSFGGTGDDGDPYDFFPSTSIVPSGDGGFLIGGPSASGVSGNKTSPNYGDFDYWLFKIDANGNKLWDRSFGGNKSDILTSIAPAPDGGFLLGGLSRSDVSGNKTSAHYGNGDYWVVKVDVAGNKLWESSYGGSAEEHLYSTALAHDGGILLGGQRDVDFWLVKVDATGTKLWEQSFGASYTGATGVDILGTVLSTETGGVLLGGGSNSGISGNKTSPNYGERDFWVVKLASQGGPTILTQPAPQQVFMGSTATFAVSATSTNPPLRYQWRFNGAELSGATNESFTITNAQWSNLGDYQVVVTDSVGSIRSVIVSLSLIDALFITTQPTNVAVRAGSNATFTVAVYGTKPLRYQWRRDGVDVANATNSVLTVPNVQAAQLGDYTAVITNQYGAVTSAVATLTFLTPPLITQYPQPVTVVVGENATFMVTVTNTATLPVTYQWRKASMTLTNIVLYSRTCSFTLFNVRTNVTSTNGPGNYRVVTFNAANSVAGVASSFAALTVVPGVPRPTISSYARLTNSAFQVRFVGAAGTNYTVLASSDLLDWSALGAATATASGQFEFTDADAPNHGTRFYQLRSP